jgi:hypothetical protein
MEYQLVLLWPTSLLRNYRRLILEEAVMAGIGDLGTVDGHDMGSGEMTSLFSLNNPNTLLSGSNQFPRSPATRKTVIGGVGENEYTPIYPDALEHFAVK